MTIAPFTMNANEQLQKKSKVGTYTKITLKTLCGLGYGYSGIQQGIVGGTLLCVVGLRGRVNRDPIAVALGIALLIKSGILVYSAKLFFDSVKNDYKSLEQTQIIDPV